MSRRASRVVALSALIAVVALGDARPARVADAAPAGDVDPLVAARRAYSKRLSDVAATARDGKLGSIALRLFQDAQAFDSENDDARLVLGWKKGASGWSPPGPLVLAGEGWPDDGEADLTKIVKKEADARSEYVKALVAAAQAARGKNADAADRLLWAALAAAPDSAEARRALGHKETSDGGHAWIAPEHVAIADAERARRRALSDAVAQALGAGGPDRRDVALEEADPPKASLKGWPTPIAKGPRGPFGDGAYSLSPTLPVAEAARAAAKTRAFVSAILGEPPSAPRPIQFLLVPSHDIADALMAEDGSVDAATREASKNWAAWPFGTTGFDLLVAESPGAAVATAVDRTAHRAVAGRTSNEATVRWIEYGMGWAANETLLGVPRGYGMTPFLLRANPGVSLRPGEGAYVYVRRLVALGLDRPLRELASADANTLMAGDAAKAGALLDWLVVGDVANAGRPKALVSALLAPSADQASHAIDAAAKAAGFDRVEAMDEAWRRWVIDRYPGGALEAGALGGPWKVTKLERSKQPTADVDSLFTPLARAVTGSLWLAGRPYTCRPVDDGQAVALYPMKEGKPDRVVREPGVYPFSIPREFGGGESAEFRVALARDGLSWTARAADSLAGTIDGHAVEFFDVDCDGRWGGFERDGYRVGKSRDLLPLRSEIVLGTKAYELRRVGPDGREVAWRSRPLAAKGQDLEELLRWNAWRSACGIPPLDWDEVAAAQAKQKDPPPGALTFPVSKPAGPPAPRTLSDAFRSRVGVDPDLRAVGWALVGDRLVVVPVHDETGLASAFRGPVIFPGDGADGVPASDGANPFPMSVTFVPGTDLAAQHVEATLALEAATGAGVELSTPADVPGTVLITPKGPLGRHTAYRLTVTWGPPSARVTRKHGFTTGE